MAQEHSWDKSHLLESGRCLEEVPTGMHKDRSSTDTCPEFLLYYYNAGEIVTIAKLAAPSNTCIWYAMEILIKGDKDQWAEKRKHQTETNSDYAEAHFRADAATIGLQKKIQAFKQLTCQFFLITGNLEKAREGSGETFGSSHRDREGGAVAD